MPSIMSGTKAELIAYYRKQASDCYKYSRSLSEKRKPHKAANMATQGSIWSQAANMLESYTIVEGETK